jgi:hypothetical protein
MLSELGALKFFPRGDAAVLLALTRLCGAMCHNEGEVRWLINRMTSGLYSEWPGLAEMRACFCSKFRPKDGISTFSTVYLDGIPSEQPTRAAIAGPDLLALPEGRSASADAEGELVALALVAGNTVTRSLGGRVTAAEIAAAPDWLRKLEGYK